MLRKCTQQEFEKYADFVYQLALDPAKSGYLCYSDGIKTKAMFLEQSQRALGADTEEILLFEYNGVVEGWIHYYCIPEDKYLSTESFAIAHHTAIALQEFLDLLQARYKGYDLFLGYDKKNCAAIDFLASNGFVCIEDDYNTNAFLERYSPIAAPNDVVRITKDNYDLFRTLHRKVENDMYWNSDRIYEDMDNWVIFAKICQGEAVGSVYCMTGDDEWFEIFGIDRKDDAFDAALVGDLLAKALNTAKELGGKYMSFFCDKQEQTVADRLGFVCVGEYVCYKKQLV